MKPADKDVSHKAVHRPSVREKRAWYTRFMHEKHVTSWQVVKLRKLSTTSRSHKNCTAQQLTDLVGVLSVGAKDNYLPNILTNMYHKQGCHPFSCIGSRMFRVKMYSRRGPSVFGLCFLLGYCDAIMMPTIMLAPIILARTYFLSQYFIELLCVAYSLCNLYHVRMRGMCVCTPSSHNHVPTLQSSIWSTSCLANSI